MTSISRLTCVLLAVAACGGSSPPPAKTAEPAPRTAADLGPMCQRHFERQKACEDDFLSALLELRVELDMPPGIAAAYKSEGRDALLAQAHTEFAADSAPDKVAATCDAIATKTPPDQVERLLKAGEECEAAADCKAFSACAVATQRSYIASGAQH